MKGFETAVNFVDDQLVVTQKGKRPDSFDDAKGAIFVYECQ